MSARTGGSQGVFGRRMVLALAGLCTVSVLVGLALSIFQDELGSVGSAGNDTYSYSALGHRGFKTLLEEMGRPVLVSRNDSELKVGSGGVLVLAEPDLLSRETQSTQRFWEMCDDAAHTLVVLPKRRGMADPLRPGHISSVLEAPTRSRELVLDMLGVDGQLAGVGHTRDLTWDHGAWSDRPFIAEAQLLRTEDVEPLIACEEGILLGRLNISLEYFEEPLFGGDILVLSDPDLLANFGLGLGRNAEIAVKIIDHLHQGRGVVVFDETLHGHGVSPSLMRAFFRMPLAVVLIQALLTCAVLLWLAVGRFGRPGEPAAPPGRGLEYLIDNTAELLDFGGHRSFVLGRYYQAAVGTICRRLHLDPPQSSAEAGRRLAAITRNRSPEFDFEKMNATVPATALDGGARNQEVLALARAIHRWQQEMSHGS